MMENEEWKAAIAGRVEVRVIPRAASERVLAEAAPENGGWRLKAYVTCVPEDGKANAAVIALLAKTLRLPKSAFTIVRGQTSRNKLVDIMR